MSKKDKVINIGKDEIAILGQVVSDDRFKFSKEDLEAVKNPDPSTSTSSQPFWRAQVVLKKVRSMRKAAAKGHYRKQAQDAQAAKKPITREEAGNTFVRIKEGQELGASLKVMLDILIGEGIISMEEFDRRWQVEVLNGRHPDPCPSCCNRSEKNKECMIKPDHRTTNVAKELYTDLTGDDAERVIGCNLYEFDDTDKTTPKEPLEGETKDEKSDDNEEGAKDNG